MFELEGAVNRHKDKDRFAWGADTLLTQCMLCAHLGKGPLPVCAAFPGAIPPEILANEYDHRRPWIDPATGEPGDRGVDDIDSITFQPRPGINPVTLDLLYRHLGQLPA